MMMHPACRAMAPLVALLLSMVALPAGAQQVSVESLMATADSALAAARAGVATAELKIRLEEEEMEEQAARERAAAASASASAPVVETPAPARAPAPPVAPTPENRGEVPDSRPEASPSPQAAQGDDVRPASGQEDSAAAPDASSDRLNTLLPAPVVAQAIAEAESAAGEGTRLAEDAPGAGTMEPATAIAREDRVDAGTLATTGLRDASTAALPLGDLVGTTLENGLAGAASITADWTTLFRGLVDRHPGLMPALLLLMTAAGATALALGAGIRPGRRRQAAVGHDGDTSAPAGPRPQRMRPEQRVPRDVAAVLASLEGRRGGSPLYGRDPGDGTTTAARRQA